MKRGLTTAICLGLFFSMWAAKPYYRIGQSNKTVGVLTVEVVKLLMDSDFEVLGMYHPHGNKNLQVIVFTRDELTSMATSVADKGAFGATLKIGLIGMENSTDISLLNPNYINHAFYGGSTNAHEAQKMTALTDSLIKKALLPLVSEMEYYGKDIPNEELGKYQFLPTMPRYRDVVELNEFDEYLEAVATIKKNLLQGVDSSRLVYELNFHDKEIALFGLAFKGDNCPEKQMLTLMGVECIPSLPLEILVQGNKAYMLNGKYRIPLFNSSLGITKIFKIMGISSDISTRMENIATLYE
ncbi:hypothetical protein SAMN06265379_101580 [Saccharicrinis carchari]|uniref:Uncharacterized protein n=1 Tax=Saccharicrinis carchari TaxID=1168039 RepID=A0A521B1A4_SACCC|nr:hypothetical protein [Saccharicrinis carchari]SMO40874.1 hypothetical protein SAMN06265379_101580 [Saccharicrinis carchari]